MSGVDEVSITTGLNNASSGIAVDVHEDPAVSEKTGEEIGVESKFSVVIELKDDGSILIEDTVVGIS